ncbi:TPA: LysR family transcriptional regulator [Pseudomonas aeruginosa]|nr:LysR family transcriptional regulator [Pseudomonas aeruginosa]HCR1218462.1 LysR family transcriptional regulator [Pseudomonas aeruginosa]
MTRHFDDLQLGSLELFCLAAESGSFTAAANQAGVTPAAVSRSVARLEERLGVRLFVRSTRQMRLSDAGRDYHQQCRQALAQLLEAGHRASGSQLSASGLLRISVPTPYAHHRLLPALPYFRERYPAVDVDVHVSTRNIDFTEEGFDLAIRGSEPADSTLVARRLEEAELVLVAAPDYLRRRGRPRHLDDLAEHECIQFERPSSGRRVPWNLLVDGRPLAVATRGGYSCQEDYLAGTTLALAGAGIFQAYRFSVQRALDNGELEEVLPRHGGAHRPFFLLYPHARYLPQRVRAFVEFAMEQLARPRRLSP